MAIRLNETVVRGEIDNTVEGRTSGWIWLLGRSEPVILELEGDCWRDLAGTRLKFRNPEPLQQSGLLLARNQKGLVGDMTASRKTRVAVCDSDESLARQAAGEEVPTVWKNSLYLEWFSEADGRVVLETNDFEMELFEHQWQMDEDAEEAQKLANMQAMRDFLNRMIGRLPAGKRDKEPSPDDEVVWEERLKESDRLTDAYQEVLEKYMDDPDSEQKEAFVMGWDGLLETMAAESEGKEPPAKTAELADAPVEEEAWEDGDEDLFKEHPLQQDSMELALRAIDLLCDHSQEGSDSALVTSELMQLAAKLAGALGGTYEREVGYVLAILKRCLASMNEVLSACGRLADRESDPDRERALEALRDEVFELRSKLTNLRSELRGS